MNFECRNDPNVPNSLPYFEYIQQWNNFKELWEFHEDLVDHDKLWIGLKLSISQ